MQVDASNEKRTNKRMRQMCRSNLCFSNARFNAVMVVCSSSSRSNRSRIGIYIASALLCARRVHDGRADTLMWLLTKRNVMLLLLMMMIVMRMSIVECLRWQRRWRRHCHRIVMIVVRMRLIHIVEGWRRGELKRV